MLRAFILPLLLLGLFVPASPESTPSAYPSYEEQFAEIRNESTNPVVLAVIEDDFVTDEEVTQLINGFLSCMADNGFPDVVPVPDDLIPGSHHFRMDWPTSVPGGTPPSTAEAMASQDAAFWPCMSEWGRPLAIRDAMYVNPDNEDIFILNLECLHRYDLVPDGFDYGDIEHAAMAGDWGSGVEPGTLEFTRCLVNPLQIGLDPMPLPGATPGSTPTS